MTRQQMPSRMNKRSAAEKIANAGGTTNAGGATLGIGAANPASLRLASSTI